MKSRKPNAAKLNSSPQRRLPKKKPLKLPLPKKQQKKKLKLTASQPKS